MSRVGARHRLHAHEGRDVRVPADDVHVDLADRPHARRGPPAVLVGGDGFGEVHDLLADHVQLHEEIGPEARGGGAGAPRAARAGICVLVVVGAWANASEDTSRNDARGTSDFRMMIS